DGARGARSNVARHSGASRATVFVNGSQAGGLDLVIEDNGHGFDTTTPGVLGHQGMANMRSRMDAVGATFEVVSDATGTRVRVHAPTDGPTASERNGDARPRDPPGR